MLNTYNFKSINCSPSPIWENGHRLCLVITTYYPQCIVLIVLCVYHMLCIILCYTTICSVISYPYHTFRRGVYHHSYSSITYHTIIIPIVCLFLWLSYIKMVVFVTANSSCSLVFNLPLVLSYRTVSSAASLASSVVNQLTPSAYDAKASIAW